jgi:eukaryotic-like serine/threonine-protein kinase
MVTTGDTIGPFVLVRELGRGGYGVVWLAERRGSLATTQVAVKVPLDVEPDLEALTWEARIWVQASGHPNVLPVIEAEVYDGQIVIVSEYAAGGSLSSWLGQQPGRVPPLAKAREMAVGILAGLTAYGPSIRGK